MEAALQKKVFSPRQKQLENDILPSDAKQTSSDKQIHSGGKTKHGIRSILNYERNEYTLKLGVALSTQNLANGGKHEIHSSTHPLHT